jgi:hypothetical protein
MVKPLPTSPKGRREKANKKYLKRKFKKASPLGRLEGLI